ncbi:MAG: hypothetical protein U0793_01030 [Gemmataceae bacterium]
MYQAYALLLPESPFTLEQAAARLNRGFATFTLKQSEEQLSLIREDWEIHLVLEEGAQVLEESEGIAEGIGGDQEEMGIRRCNRRVAVWSDIPDPEMAHFSDFQSVVDMLKSFPGVIVVDPRQPSLL